MEYRRLREGGATWFFTAVTEYRRPLLVAHLDRLREAFRHSRKKQPFVVDAIVILPDHLHTLWTLPADDSDYSERWKTLKRKFSAGLPARPSSASQKKKREKGIWQRRFWEHRVRDDEELRRLLDYIHYNPVKHGYVPRVRDWPHSSFHRFVKRGWYDLDWGANVLPEVLEMDFE